MNTKKWVKYGILVYLLFSGFLLSYADTVDVWIVKVNGMKIAESSAGIIENHPISLRLNTFENQDELSFEYWSDTFLQTSKWYLRFCTNNKELVAMFANAIDSSIQCYPSPCETFTLRKGFISFKVFFLKELIESYSVEKFFIYFKMANKEYSSEYLDTPFFVIFK